MLCVCASPAGGRYNIGAGRKGRTKALFTCLPAAGAIVDGAALFIVGLFPAQLIGVFDTASEDVRCPKYEIIANHADRSPL